MQIFKREEQLLLHTLLDVNGCRQRLNDVLSSPVSLQQNIMGQVNGNEFTLEMVINPWWWQHSMNTVLYGRFVQENGANVYGYFSVHSNVRSFLYFWITGVSLIGIVFPVILIIRERETGFVVIFGLIMIFFAFLLFLSMVFTLNRARKISEVREKHILEFLQNIIPSVPADHIADDGE